MERDRQATPAGGLVRRISQAGYLIWIAGAAFFMLTMDYAPVFAKERADAVGATRIMISVSGPEEAVLEIKKNNQLAFLKRSIFAIISALVFVIAAFLLYGLRFQLLKKLIKRKRGATPKNTH